MKHLRKRLSPAMIVASLALVMAMTGSAVAAGLIGSGQIKDGSIRGKDIHKNQLTSVQIRENKLSAVPAAVTADSAATATTAGTATTLAPAAADALKTRWLLINEAGQIEEQSGGFTIIDAYTTNTNVYIDSGASMVGHGLSATVALQNKVDTSGDGAPDSNFQGEVSVARCQTAAVECAPPGAKNVKRVRRQPSQQRRLGNRARHRHAAQAGLRRDH